MSDKPKCRGPECDRDMTARQLCNAHVQQLYAGKELTPIRKPKTLEESKEEFLAPREPTGLEKAQQEILRMALLSHRDEGYKDGLRDSARIIERVIGGGR